MRNWHPLNGMRQARAHEFPPGARVLVDGRDEAIVRQAFPEGSSSYAFPHYKVDFVGGDKNVAVPLARVGIDKKAAHDEDGRCTLPECSGENTPDRVGECPRHGDGPCATERK